MYLEEEDKYFKNPSAAQNILWDWVSLWSRRQISWMFNFGGFTDSPHPHKQKNRGLDTIQATSFFSLVAISLLSRKV